MVICAMLGYYNIGIPTGATFHWSNVHRNLSPETSLLGISDFYTFIRSAAMSNRRLRGEAHIYYSRRRHDNYMILSK
jgi:hypothetical protein